MSEHLTLPGEASDAELLRLLRDGETEAYAELWRRHVRAALRLGRRLAPGRAEDLVSEAFLAVHHQITTAGNGPESAFRAYLFTTMRNTAIRWGRESKLVDVDPELEAFQALPERWQRVLWLTEVEQVSRPRIAAELGIKPNAVSALYRRARQGLRLQWLTQQVPPELREDPGHIARLLPGLVLDGKAGHPARRAAEHLRQCPVCAELADDLESARRRMGRGTLAALGFAGLGVILPAAAQTGAATVGAGAASALLAAGGAALAATVGLLSIHAALPPGDLPIRGTESIVQVEQSDRSHDSGSTASSTSGEALDSAAGSPATGRGNQDPNVPWLGFDSDGVPDYFYVPPPSPGAEEPGESDGPDGAQPDEQPAAPDPGLITPPLASGYLAPVIAGTASPGRRSPCRSI